MKVLLSLFPFYKSDNWDAEGSSKLPKVTTNGGDTEI